MATVSATIHRDKYKTLLHSPTHQLIADEPLGNGGQDLGFSPSELLAAALATCTCVTLRMYADQKGWPLDGVHVNVVFRRDKELNESFFGREVTLHGPLEVAQRERLLQIANGCYIHRVLTHPIHIETTLLP